MATSSKIVLGLPQYPNNKLPPDVYGDMLAAFLAIQNLLRGVSYYSGIDPPPANEEASIAYSDTILQGNLTRLYPIASVAIARGQAINLHNNAGIINARLAKADSATTMAHGLANDSASPGQRVEINLWQTWTDAISGLVPGTLYYLSPGTAGAVQSSRPSTAGQIIQSMGVALSAGYFALNISSHYQQL
jgi:hypothetical protein